MKEKTKISLIVIVVLGVTMLLSRLAIGLLDRLLSSSVPEFVEYLLFYLSWLFTVTIGMGITYGFTPKTILDELGLSKGLVRGVGFAFLATLPMLLGYAAFSKRVNLSVHVCLNLAVLPGLIEELLFRGFVFGQLFRKGGWGFIPAVTVSALFFASGHLYQAEGLIGAVLILIVTFAGASWFAWLFVEWDFNLWVPIGLHTFMNLWWIVFEAGANVLGGLLANIFRAMTIAITVFVTIRKNKANGMRINRCNLWRHKENCSKK